MRAVDVLMLLTGSMALAGCAFESEDQAATLRTSRGASSTGGETTRAAQAIATPPAPSAPEPAPSGQTPSCTPSEKTTSVPCADSAMVGSVVTKKANVCSDPAAPSGKEVITETDECRFPCTERTWIDNQPCGPNDVEERIYVHMRHICDGSERGKGKDVTESSDTSGCQGHSPLVLDLDGDGLTVLDLASSRATFDLLNDGRPVHTAWVGPREALLSLDRDGDGIINDRLELFGNMRGAANGFEDLAAYDDNADGVLDASDMIYGLLRLWLDGDGDGVCRPGELSSLVDEGVVAIDLRAESLGLAVSMGGQWISDRSTFMTAGGATRRVYDVWFKAER